MQEKSSIGQIVLKYANFVMTAAFLLSVALQFNDPDPIQWMAIYGAAAAACIVSLRGKLRWQFPVLVGAVALVWAIALGPSALGRTTFGEMTASMQMVNLEVEEAREMLGLLIVFVWMAVLTIASRRSASKNV